MTKVTLRECFANPVLLVNDERVTAELQGDGIFFIALGGVEVCVSDCICLYDLLSCFWNTSLAEDVVRRETFVCSQPQKLLDAPPGTEINARNSRSNTVPSRECLREVIRCVC